MSLALLCPGQGAQHPAMFDHVRGMAARRLVLGQIVGEHPDRAESVGDLETDGISSPTM